jgi:glycosyltransferase domain-containing protein
VITILIPTYNRPGYLKRILSYYSNYATAYPIVVADSSSNENKDMNRKTVSSLSSINILYIDSYTSEINRYHKITDALNQVNTEYCAICADDDFLVPESMRACTQFLNDHTDYAAAQGVGVSFAVDRKLPSTGGWSFRTIQTQSGKTLSQDRPTDRLYCHLCDYRPTFYAVHRRTQLAQNLQMANDYTWDFRFGEILPSCLTVVQGKVKRLYMPHDVGECHGGNTSARIIDWGGLLTGDDFSSRYQAFRECLARKIAEITGEHESAATAAVNKAALAYFGKVYSQYSVSGQRVGGLENHGAYLRLRQVLFSSRRLAVAWRTAVSAKRMLENPLAALQNRALLHNHEISTIRRHVLRHAESVYRDGLEGSCHEL